jgi:hypothetical protein
MATTRTIEKSKRLDMGEDYTFFEKGLKNA